MNGLICGIFGSSREQKNLLENSIAKKSEVEGIIVYHRSESGVRYSFHDDQFPERIQGYARIASLSDYAFYIYPKSGKLSVPDGELAILLDSYGIQGRVEVVDSSATKESVISSLRGLSVASFPLEERDSNSSIVDFSNMRPSNNFPRSSTIIYIDRAFNVKGVGIVVLGFVLSGKVSLHDKLRLLPNSAGTKYAEVKGIQVSDEDYTESQRGVRVGLSLKGVELKDLLKTSWLDDGSFLLSSKLSLNFKPSPYYKQPVTERDLHFQLPGEMVFARAEKGEREDLINLKLQSEVPIWNGLRGCLVDLNAKNLRVTGGGTVLLENS